MSEVIASEIWGELKRFVNTVDRAEASETVIQILMDNDSDVEDIRAAFKGDAAQFFSGPITVGEDGMLFSMPAGGTDIQKSRLN